jgi:hypothetical protein
MDKAEEAEVKIQESMISEVLEGFIPVAPVSTTETATEVKSEEGVQTDEPKGEERKAEETSEQIPAGEVKSEEKTEEVVVPPTTEVVAPVTPVVVAPVVPVQETEVDRLKRENAEFRLHLSEMADRLQAPAPKPVLTAEQQAAEAAKPRQAYRFIKDDGAYDEATSSADNFNILLTTVVNTAVERALRMIPQVATGMVEQQIDLRSSVDEFFKKNQDLIPQRKYVGFVTNEVTASHPDWNLGQILEETEKLSRERLKLPRIVPTQNGERGARTVTGNPAFVPGGGSRRGTVQTDTLTGEDKQILDIIS